MTLWDSHAKFIQNPYSQGNFALNLVRMVILIKFVKPASFYLIGNAPKYNQVNDSNYLNTRKNFFEGGRAQEQAA